MSQRLIAATLCALGLAGCTEEQTYFQCSACFTGQPLPGTCASTEESGRGQGSWMEDSEKSSVVHDLCMKWDRSLSPEARTATGVKESLTAETRASLGVSELYAYCSSAIDAGKWPVKTTCRAKTERVSKPFMGWK